MYYQKKATFLTIFASLLISAAPITVISQTSDRSKNNPYSPSPSARSKLKDAAEQPIQANIPEASTAKVSRNMEIRRPVVEVSYIAASVPTADAANPVSIYKVGVGDVIFVNLKNTVAAYGYYTVRSDGTIDYPLAGKNVVVIGKTTAEIERFIASGVTLYTRPQFEVKVREFASHKINVSGMVERSGEKNLQREAIPMYVIRADALVDPKATKALIRRADMTKVETYDLHDAKTDDVLIYPGNSVEFTMEGKNSVLTTTGSYYIAGEVKTSGQKDLVAGMTLSQAILAANSKGNPKKALVRRKGSDGTLNVAEHNLRAIKDGKAADPVLQPGDMIEIGN